jgi:hypothetical protein
MVLLLLIVVVRSPMQIGVPAVDLFWQSGVALASSLIFIIIYGASTPSTSLQDL